MNNNNGLNLGQLIDAVDKLPDDTVIRYDFGYFAPKGHCSYRGYYEDLALGYEDDFHTLTAKYFANTLRSYIGTEISGYKGGDYTVTRDTGVWVAKHSGDCTGTVIFNVRDLGYGNAILETRYED